jgi:hypothetical protein
MTERRYGVWTGNPEGLPENELRCIVEVHPRGALTSHQCRRLRGHGVDGLVCKQHAKISARIVWISEE